MTPRPFANSGTSSSGKISSLRFSPMTATESPSTKAQTAAFASSGTFITFLLERVMATASSSFETKPWPEFAALLVHEHGDDIGFGRKVDEASYRLALPASARQLGAIEREEAAVGGKH